MTRPKPIGIVAVSAEGAALCYRTICREAPTWLGAHAHPEIAMHSHSLAEYVVHLAAGRWDEVGRLLEDSARKLVGAGAGILVCPDNTVHPAIDALRQRSPVPWLHIAEEVARVAAELGVRRLGILGTRLLTEGPVYPARLRARGIACELPTAAERERIDRIIFDELVAGETTTESRRELHDVIRGLGGRGCDAVVLGCTELPLLLDCADSPLPTIDSTRVLARAALRESIPIASG